MIIIKYKRKPTICQMQITDYINGKNIKLFDTSIKGVYGKVRKLFPWVPVKRYRKAKSFKSPPKSQKKIYDYINWIPKLPGKYLYRFPRVATTTYTDFASPHISKLEWDMLHFLPKYNGSFENIFELNDFSYFDEIQEKLESTGVSFKGMYLRDSIMVELLRINLGMENFRHLERIHNFNPFLISHLFMGDYSFPSAADMSYVIKKIPSEYIFAYFQQLVKECVDCGIIIPRILMWDGQFIHANSSNNKKEGAEKYGDPDAGYCRHNGTKKGVGYDPGILYAYCKDRWFPIYFKMFPGNRNDSKAFMGTMKDFLKVTPYNWDVLLSDSGPYSLANLTYIRNQGILPIIRSRKGIKNQPVKELKKGYYFNTDFIPDNWTEEFYLKIYAFRPMIEQGNSSNNTYYNASRLNTFGMDSAEKNRAFLYILELLKALTAYKCGRPDLIMKPTAFENTKDIYWQDRHPQIAERNNYKILDPFVTIERNTNHYRSYSYREESG